jgi:hypothetical protein
VLVAAVVAHSITAHLIMAAQVEQAAVEQGVQQHQIPELLALLTQVEVVVQQQSLKQLEETKQAATAAPVL